MRKAEFGDFQTPVDFARQITQFVKSSGVQVSTIVEPTCGLGNFLVASAEIFGNQASYYGFDINAEYVHKARWRLSFTDATRIQIECQNFYDKDWRSFFRSQPDGVLVIGNPPWVTNADLGAMGSSNLPEKSNFQGYSGLAAKTGKANFDISEWMLIKLLEALHDRQATLAMLCKTGTARKVLRYAWRNEFDIANSSVHVIDIASHFGVSVSACLLVVHTGRQLEKWAAIYANLSFDCLIQRFGMRNDQLIADIDAYESLREIDGIAYRRWRSGVKHDAAKVMEFIPKGNRYVNGLGEYCNIESTYLYPLLKSSDVANGRLCPIKRVLLTQQNLTDETISLKYTAPKTWRYLIEHSEYLDRRKSSIYAKRPRFAVFGVGTYTFSPWKVAISGLYKNVVFRVIGSLNRKPIVVDDTCYFIACASNDEAEFFSFLLNSDLARRFIQSLVFFDAKRPITIDVLRRVNLKKLAERLGREEEARAYLKIAQFEQGNQQFLLIESNENQTSPSD